MGYRLCMPAKLLQSRLTLCYPMDCRLLGSHVSGILQARILEWVVMPSPGDLPDPGTERKSPVALAWQADSLQLSQQGNPWGCSPWGCKESDTNEQITFSVKATKVTELRTLQGPSFFI